MSKPPGPKGPQLLHDAALAGVVGGSSIGFGALSTGGMAVGFSNRTLGAELSTDPPPPPPEQEAEPELEEDEGGIELFVEEESSGGGGSPDAGVKVAPGDLNGDGVIDIHLGNPHTGGPGSSPGPQGGVYVPRNDVDGDGRPDF
jgi:hypothetical protein